jgi:hypothetical protein
MESSGKEAAAVLKNTVIKENLKGQFGQLAQKNWRDYNGPTGIKPAGKYNPEHPTDQFRPHYCPCPFPKAHLPIRDFTAYIEHEEDRCGYIVKSTGRDAPFEAAAHAEKHFEWWYEMNKQVENGIERPPERCYPIILPQWSKDGPMSNEDMKRKKMRERLAQEDLEREHKAEIEDAKTDFTEEKRRVGRPPTVKV